MANTAVLRVQVLVDSARAAAGLDKTAGGVKKFQDGMKSLAAPAAVGLAAIVAVGKKSIDAASDMQQAFGGIDAVFGKSSAAVKQFATDAADSVGLAASEYGDLATIIGSQLKNAGTPIDKLAGKTNDLIKLGADLAATYGGTTAEAVGALSSALKGEFDPLERYGTSLSQTAINAQMAADHTDKLKGKQKTAAKQAATLALIQGQTADATGKFSSEADTAAGQAARSNAAWKNALAVLGTQLLPAVTAITGKLAELATWVAKNGDIILPVVAALAAFAVGIIVVTAAMAAFNAVMALNPVVLVVVAIVALTVAFIILFKRSKGFHDFVMKMWNQQKALVLGVWAVIKAVVLGVFAALKGAFNVLKAVAAAVWGAIKTAAAAVWGAIKTGFNTVANSPIWGKLERVGKAAINALLAPIKAVASAFDSVINAVRDVINWIGKLKFPSPPGWLSKLPGVGSLSATAAAPAAGVRGSPSLGRSGLMPASAGGRGSLVINVNGVLDGPDAARKIRQVLRDDDRRRAGIQLRPAGRG